MTAWRCTVELEDGGRAMRVIDAPSRDAAVLALVGAGQTPIAIDSGAPSLVEALVRRADPVVDTRFCEVRVTGDAILVSPPDGSPWSGPAPERLTEENRARLAGIDAPLRIWLAPGDVLWLPIAPGDRTIAAALDAEAPLPANRLGWGIAGSGVVVAHRDRLKALAAVFQTHALFAEHDGVAVPLSWPRATARVDQGKLAALLLLATIPFTIWGGADLLTQRLDSATLQLRGRMDARRTTAAPDPFAAPPVSQRLATLARAWPDGVGLHALAALPDGRIELEADVADPDALRPLLRDDPALQRLREVDQRMVPNGTIRMRLQEATR